MSAILQQEIPYHQDSSVLVDAIADLPWTVYLDSCHPDSTYGRYDIIVADPVITVQTSKNITRIQQGNIITESEENPFDIVRSLLGDQIHDSGGLPFIGGALGFFSYDLARRIEKLPTIAKDDTGLPEMVVGIYDWAVIVDHQTQRSVLVSAARHPSTHEQWNTLVERLSHPAIIKSENPLSISGEWMSNMGQSEYRAAFDRIQQYIVEGDCYQVNLAQRFQVPGQGEPWPLYRRLRQLNPSPFSAYMNYPFATIMSSSPERFIQLHEGKVETKPIKGTRPRSSNPVEDQHLKEALASSSKDKAENLMIVDLLRNDLGKCCKPGSIEVTRLFDVESFPNVHHLVSTITGQLATGQDALSLLQSAFPGGSITGAPKLRAMEIIEELEPHRRGIYCGSIGYIGYDGRMDTNIAIRTFLYKDGWLRYSSGGGIVADSNCDEEYRETYHKAKAMFDLFKQPVV